MTHSGFEHVFCYGDILLSFVWSHEGPPEVKQKQSVVSTEETPMKQSTSFMMKHDFVRTQFHRTTHCDFCTKKIWLKDAVQCRGCALCCHKKCIAKCQMNTECVPNDKISDGVELLQPEIVTTEIVDECGDTIQNSLKRVNSVNNLSIPGKYLLYNFIFYVYYIQLFYFCNKKEIMAAYSILCYSDHDVKTEIAIRNFLAHIL